jgi:outer membrane protein TolC
MTTAQSDIVDSMDFQGKGETLTLKEAVEQMLKDNPTIEQAQLDLEQANVDYDKKKYDIKRMKKVLGDKREDSALYLENVKWRQMVCDYGIANAERNYEATLEKVKADIEQAYFSLLQAEEAKEIHQSNLEIAKDLHEKTKKKLELGLVARQEVLNSELNCINAEKDYKAAQNRLKQAKMFFNTKLGYPVMTEVSLKDALEYKPFQPGSIAEAISKAFVHRNEIKAVEFAYTLEKLNMDIIAKRYPDMTFQYKQQEVALEKAQKELEDAKNNIEMEVRSFYLEALQKQEEIRSGQKAIELAKETLRLSQLNYDVGTGILTDVQKAQIALQQAKLGLSKAILDYHLAVLQFNDAMGVGRKVIHFAQ